MGAITEYLVSDDLPTMRRLRTDVAHSLVPEFLMTASAILLNAVNTLTQDGATAPEGREARQIEAQLETLRQRGYQLQGVA